MIPTRSASCSASSRYCVVRKTVVPSSLSARTSRHSAVAARRVQAGRRLVEEQHARAVHEREREVEPAAHAAGVAADAPVGGVGEPDALEQLVGARLRASGPRRPCSAPCMRSSSRPVISGSIAASCSATPIARRTASASRTTSWPATQRVARGRAQQRGEDAHRRRLARAVGPEEAVDLALGRPRGRRRRRRGCRPGSCGRGPRRRRRGSAPVQPTRRRAGRRRPGRRAPGRARSGRS